MCVPSVEGLLWIVGWHPVSKKENDRLPIAFHFNSCFLYGLVNIVHQAVQSSA